MRRSKVLAGSREKGQLADDAVEWVMYRHRPAVLQDPFLVRVDGEEDDEEVMEMEDLEVVKEVGSSSILHWNYRNLTHLPQELLGEFWWSLNILHLSMFKCTVNRTFDRANPEYGNTPRQFFWGC